MCEVRRKKPPSLLYLSSQLPLFRPFAVAHSPATAVVPLVSGAVLPLRAVLPLVTEAVLPLEVVWSLAISASCRSENFSAKVRKIAVLPLDTAAWSGTAAAQRAVVPLGRQLLFYP